MRDEALAIRREIGLERGNDRRQHAAYTRALNHGFSLTSNICNQSFQFLIFPAFSLLGPAALFPFLTELNPCYLPRFMLSGEIRNQIDRVWDSFWAGGIAN